MFLLSKYNTAYTIYFPLIKANVANFAVSGDYTHASGDVKISKDGGAAATATNAPSAIAMGNGAIWSLTLTATEMQAATIVVTIIDAATKAIEDQCFIIHTYGNASAKYQHDLSDSVRLGLTALPNAAAEAAGGLFTRGSGAGQINQSANGNIDANTVKISGTAQTAGDIYPLIDTEVAAIKSKTDQLVFTVANQVDSNVITKTGFSLSSAGVQAIWDALSSALTTAGSIGKRMVDYLTGDIFARIGAPVGASTSADIAAVKTVADAIATYVDTEVAAIKAKTDNLPSSPAAVGSAMTLAADAVNATALAASAVNEIAAALEAAHGTGSWQGDSTIAGGNALTISIRCLGVPVVGMQVIIRRNSAPDDNYATVVTDGSGDVTLSISDGTYSLYVDTGYRYEAIAPVVKVVSNPTETTTINLVENSETDVPSTDMALVKVRVIGNDGEPKVGITMTVTLKAAKSVEYDDKIIQKIALSGVTDVNGYTQVETLRSDVIDKHDSGDTTDYQIVISACNVLLNIPLDDTTLDINGIIDLGVYLVP